MKKCLPLFGFTIVLVFACNSLLANWQITSVEQLSKPAVQYEKVEFDLQITGAFTNPYDQKDIRVDAVFAAPSGESLLLPCYYVSGDGAASGWKARFAPRESGTYTYHVEIRIGSALESASAPAILEVTASAKNGFLHAGNNWSFEFDSGKPFRGIGENMAWEPRTWEPAKNTYDYFLPKYAENGANFFRTWMSGWNLPLEWKTVGDTDLYTNTDEYFHPQAIQRMDELVELAEAEGMYMMLALEWHGHFSPGAWWDRSSYNAANGGPAITPAEFFTLEASRAQFKNRLRYIVARWGYSTSIGAWEFFNEVDNAVNASSIPHSAITSWHTEMSHYLSEIDPYNHLITTSISHEEITGLKEIPDIDFNQKHIYRNTGSIPSTLNSYVNSTGKPYVVGEFGREWDWNIDFATIEAEKIYDYKRGQWYGLFNPTPILPMSWWWEWFDPKGTNTYYAAVQEISSKMLLAGKGSFEQLNASASGLETYAVKAGNKYFVYLLNNNTSATDNRKVSFSVSDNGPYSVQSFDPEKRSYSDLAERPATDNVLEISGLSFLGRESKVLLVSPSGSTAGEQSPFTGEAFPVPGKIEAEDFDHGGEGLAYHDLEATNTGGAYRAGQGVDIEAAASGAYYVSNIVLGEWLEYSLNIQKPGTYQLEVKVAAEMEGKSFRIELDGRNISGNIMVPVTGGMQSWETVSINTPVLASGPGKLRLYAASTAFNLDYLNFTLINQAPTVNITSPEEGAFFEAPATVEIQADATDEDGAIAKVKFYSGDNLLGEDTEAPYSFSWEVSGGTHTLTALAVDDKGLEIVSSAVNIRLDDRLPFTLKREPHPIPGKIEAEDFDAGSAGMVYHDLTPGNTFGEYRPDSNVDIEVSTDEGGGYNLGDIQLGEWVEYTVKVAEAREYDISFRLATQNDHQHFHLEIEGENITGQVEVPNTHGWQAWKSVELKNISLAEGEQVLRFVAGSEYFNINHLTFTPSPEVTGINDPWKHASALVKPNPSVENFSLQLQADASSVKVISLDGRAVFYQENPPSSLITFGKQFKSGMYVVHINYKNGESRALKVIKIK